ncbi:hypothetical protein BCR32DRAFT_265566 [Anaeromyces robustus]|uniref:Uncharacterized protein n=1 Tax=Anaeromyces robustus TaxID=1754192 RepID=A0A1Y1XJT7_9FUNG|nr:hypothetical protein BCR32DRAFT_265566 [Anaeromyces robustus]|eukprot:ORX85614.1 hypothetical protein BCR32DRAFT_265566 [Anaeromyces robustus]
METVNEEISNKEVIKEEFLENIPEDENEDQEELENIADSGNNIIQKVDDPINKDEDCNNVYSDNENININVNINENKNDDINNDDKDYNELSEKEDETNSNEYHEDNNNEDNNELNNEGETSERDNNKLNNINKNDNSNDKSSSIFNYTSIYSNITKSDSTDKKLFYIKKHIDEKKQEKLLSKKKYEEKPEIEKKIKEINIVNLTKNNLINIINEMSYEDICKFKDKLTEFGIYNQINDVLYEKQNRIIEVLVEQKQDFERKIHYQKEEIHKLRNSLESYKSKMQFVRKKTLNDICNRCGISFDKYGYPHRITVFGKSISKEELIEKTQIQSDLLECGLGKKTQVKIDMYTNPLDVMNEYFFNKSDYNPHIEDYNESYNRIKERQALMIYIKYVEKKSNLTPNYLNNNPPPNKLKHKSSLKSFDNSSKVIPTIYVEEKTNSLNLELLEYKLENLKSIVKEENDEGENTNQEKDEIENVEDINNNDYNAENNEDTDNNKGNNNDIENTEEENEIDIINDNISKSLDNTINLVPPQTNFKKINLKFSSDCKNLFKSTSSKERLSSRIMTPTPPVKIKKSLDQIYRDLEKSKPLPLKVKLPSLSSYEKKLKTDLINNSSKGKKRPYYQSKLIIDKL